jgi:hypothetical protein
MVAIGTTLYLTKASGDKTFAKFVPNATTGTWTKTREPAAEPEGGCRTRNRRDDDLGDAG